MQLQVKGKNLEVNDSIRSYVERKLQKLDRRVHELTRVALALDVPVLCARGPKSGVPVR